MVQLGCLKGISQLPGSIRIYQFPNDALPIELLYNHKQGSRLAEKRLQQDSRSLKGEKTETVVERFRDDKY